MNQKQLEYEIRLGLIKNLGEEISVETERLEKFTDRLLSKLSALMTLAGLISFLPFTVYENSANNAFLKYYLVWSFPLLVASVACWIVTFKKSAATTMNSLSVVESSDPEVTLQYLNSRLVMRDQLHKSTHNIYQRTRFYFGLSLSFVLAYLTMFILSFYFFIFYHLPEFYESLLLFVSVLLWAYIFLDWYKKPKKAVDVNTEIKIGKPVEKIEE
ncbi:hypothetical protein KC992_01230 [Candidatus Saccharibacteria bacterium]|nr:hypothetical protein [Candidatus Saccharibacteria bacterium]